MMRKVFSIALLACVFGLTQSANAGVTMDVVFDGQLPSLASHYYLASPLPDAGPGCTFTGYYNRTVATGVCMDVIIKTTDPLIALAAYVTYDNSNGLAVQQFNEWQGVGVSFSAKGVVLKSCAPSDGVTDSGSQVGNFNCVIPPANGPPSMLPGTYRIGTIVWDTSGFDGTPSLVSFTNVIVGAVINGIITDVSASVVIGSHDIIPEPGTAGLLGLGLVGLVLAGRRRRA
jgi:hypothetical protein